MNKKIIALQRQMQRQGCDLIIIASSADMRYLCGLNIAPDERSELLFVYPDRRPVLLLSKLYNEEAKACDAEFDTIIYSKDMPYDDALSIIMAKPVKKVAIDNRMWAVQLLQLQKYLGNCSYMPAAELLNSLRIIKDEDELAKLRMAGKIAVEAFERVLPELHLGMTERELASVLEIEMKRGGAEGLSFDTIVAFGKNSSMPHHVPDDTPLEANQFVLIDFGCVYQGYCSDVTRTVCFGTATTRMREIYIKVRHVKSQVKSTLRPRGVAASVEILSRDMFAQYEPAFIHTIGHGVGMYVHEAPFFGIKGDTKLQSGMVFTVEPGLYYPGEFGVRIEDMIVLTEDGYEDIYTLPDKLLEIPVK